MYQGVKKVHFIGIGGIGMSGIAEVLISYGYTVSGSDVKKSHLTERLKSLGAKISYSHCKNNLGNAQAVVYSSAISDKNPEMVETIKRKVPLVQRGEMLSEILRKGFSIAVSGAHGKTTTTAMIGKVIKSKEINPTVIMGGIVKGLSKNAILGKGKVFVAEADESDGTFQKIRPNIAVVTNIDREHMDYYRNLDVMESAYLNFLSGVPFDGMVSVCGDDKKLRSILKKLKRRFLTYGLDGSNDLRALNIESLGFGSSFTVVLRGEELGSIYLNVPGIHNVKNALAAISVGLEMGLDFKHIKKSLNGFQGVERRMEIKGEFLGATIVDDYAHHPTEVISTLKAARDVWDKRRFIVVLQPHRYSRLKYLLSSFPNSLKEADFVFVTDIYAAGEKAMKNIRADELVRLIKKSGRDAFYLEDWKKNILLIKEELREGDVLFTLGAGDITKLYEKLMAGA